MALHGVVELTDVSVEYASGGKTLRILNRISLCFEQKSSYAIVGPSGSGKTTLLAVCAGLASPTSGIVTLLGNSFNGLNEDARASVRNAHVGFVFQNFQLITTLTALENVMIPAELRRRGDSRDRAKELLCSVGLENRLDHYPAQLSGGEQQRVAIARAFMNKPDVLFADEPTGSLDFEAAANVEALLFSLQKSSGTTLIIATHNSELARRTEKIISLRAGNITSSDELSA